MAAWITPGEFDCQTCRDKPALKKQNGCTAPPTIPGGKWSFPEMKPRVVINMCPLRFLTSDIRDLFSAVSLADSRLSVTEQLALPAPYVAAFSACANERNAAEIARAKQKADL